jgi:hypothetical protein
MAQPHIILSTAQYSQLKQKLKDYETKLSDIHSQNEIKDKLTKETEDKQTKETHDKSSIPSSVAQSTEDYDSHASPSISSQKLKKTYSINRMKKPKKKIKKNQIIRMLSPPGDNAAVHTQRDIKSGQILNENSSVRKKWISI